MDALDVRLALPSDVLRWFAAPSFAELSLAISAVLRVEVSFPVLEELADPDELSDELAVAVYSARASATYPVTARGVLDTAVAAAGLSPEVETWAEFAGGFLAVEGVPVVATRQLFLGRDDWSELRLEPYAYKRRAPDSATVASVRRGRLERRDPQFEFELPKPDGTPAHGSMRIGTLRRRWAEHGGPVNRRWVSDDSSEVAGAVRGRLLLADMLGEPLMGTQTLAEATGPARRRVRVRGVGY